MNELLSIFVILITVITLLLSLRIYWTIAKYEEAALGLIFTHLEKSIFYFKIYAISISILAISRFMDVVNVYNIPAIADIATAMVLVTDILLIIVLYQLALIMNFKKVPD